MSDPKYTDPKQNPFLPCNLPENQEVPKEKEGVETDGLVPMSFTWKDKNIVPYDDIREAIRILFTSQKSDCSVDISIINDEIWFNNQPFTENTSQEIVFEVLRAAKKIKDDVEVERYIDPAQNPLIKS